MMNTFHCVLTFLETD